jgi:PTH1 family peptidyl-tRNA hydrolase
MVFGASERTGTPAEYLVVGLGNPGEELDRTRHNLGFEVVSLLASRHGGRLKAGRERAKSCEVRIGGVLTALAEPQTYMNLSGESVRMLVKRHGIADASQVVVVSDELDLPSGRVKVKIGGGTAGHNGVRSVQAHLGSAGFVRVRIGVGKPPGTQSGADYVLKRPGKQERLVLDVAVEIAADAVEAIVTNGVERAMNTYNTEPAATS